MNKEQKPFGIGDSILEAEAKNLVADSGFERKPMTAGEAMVSSQARQMNLPINAAARLEQLFRSTEKPSKQTLNEVINRGVGKVGKLISSKWGKRGLSYAGMASLALSATTCAKAENVTIAAATPFPTEPIATETVEVSIQTPEMTATPTVKPTEVVTQTPTPKPLYAECGPDPLRIGGYNEVDFSFPIGVDGLGLPTGIYEGESKNNVFNLASVLGCLISVGEYIDLIEERDGFEAIIGFYDIRGKLHQYRIVAGGTRVEGSTPTVGFNKDGPTGTWYVASFNEVHEELKALLGSSTEGKQIVINFVIYDRSAPWILSDELNSYADTHKELLEALKVGENFPEPPDGYFMYVDQLMIGKK